MTQNHDIEDQPPAHYSPETHEKTVARRAKPKTYHVNATGHIGRPAKNAKNREPRAFVQAPVKMDPELVAEFAKRTRYLPKRVNNYARFAVANVLFKTPGASDYPQEDLWEAMGRWNSVLRGVGSIEGVTERHHGWEHVQRLRAALGRAANDPMLKAKLNRPINQFLREALLSLDHALSVYFDKAVPSGLMTADELAGMAPMPERSDFKGIRLFAKPKSKPGERQESAPDPDFLPRPEQVAERKDRGPQRAALFTKAQNVGQNEPDSL